MHLSRSEALRFLNPKVVSGAFVIVDDCNSFHSSRQAVEDYRSGNVITELLLRIDHTAVHSQRTLERLIQDH